MDILHLVEEAISGEGPKGVLQFGAYHIVRQAGDGGQSSVFEATNRINKRFAIKLYKPHGPLNQPDIADNIANFVREVGHLANCHHKNIANIITAGKAAFTVPFTTWTIQEGLTGEEHENPDSVFYYVMDYIPLGLNAVFPAASRKYKSGTDPVAFKFQAGRVELFEKLIRHISDALIAIHSQNLAHKDIKSENILFSESDQNFVLADFGFARHDDSEHEKRIREFSRANLLLLQRKEFRRNDIYEFAWILQDILLHLADDYDAGRYKGLQTTLNAAMDIARTPRYPDVVRFKVALEQFMLSPRWRLSLSTGSYLTPQLKGDQRFSGKIRLPVSGSISTNTAIREIIDTKAFQRLRGVKQLGPTYFVFPGAHHTRFEHSLGCYHLALRYLSSLCKVPEFVAVCQPLEHTISVTVLAALLHDIGHYPYSHWIEEISKFPHGMSFVQHEERAESMMKDKELETLITKEWGIDIQDPSDVIASRHLHRSPALQIINSVIDGPLDLDKLDYLIRDSIHCGVSYGNGIDVSRFLESLHVDVKNKRICLNRKGRSHLMSLIAARNTMYREVYWHKTVRACTGMFKTFFYLFLERNLADGGTVSGFLSLSDDLCLYRFYETLIQSERELELLPLIEPLIFEKRKLYKTALMYDASFGQHDDVARFFGQLLEKRDYPDLMMRRQSLVEELRTIIPELQSADIVIELSPYRGFSEEYDLKDLRLYDEKTEAFTGLPEGVTTGNSFLVKNQQGYIFCHPDREDALAQLDDDEWNRILGKL